MSAEILEERKDKILKYLKMKPQVLIALVLGFIAAIGFYIRMKPMKLLIDVTTGDYFPSDPDAIGILRYVKYVIDHEKLMAVDYMRYVPFGYVNLDEFSVLTHLIVWFYKVLHFFSPSVTVGYADVAYPAFAFVVSLVFFYLFVEKVFDWKAALLASAFLTVLPAYLYRTIAGVSDKEAMAMIFFYAGIYFFLAFYMEKKNWKAILYSILAGISVSLLWVMWGGIVFVTASISIFILILVLLEKLNYKHLKLYTLFLVVCITFLSILFPMRADPISLLTSPTTGLLFFTLALTWFHQLVYVKDLLKVRKYFEKSPISPIFTSLIFISLIGFLFLLIIYDFSFFTVRISNLYSTLVKPFAGNRWALTVAESHQPYFTDIIGQFSWKYLILVFFGGVFLFYEMVKSLGKKAYSLTLAFAILLFAISMNRYSSSAHYLNGVSSLSIILYLGSIVGFFLYVCFYFYSLSKKEPKIYKEFFDELHYGYLFMTILFIFFIVGARSAVRLIFVFAPGTAILSAIGIVLLIQYSLKLKTKFLMYGVWVAAFIFVFILLNAFTTSVVAQAESSGSSYNQQWQYAMDWVRENTPEDAVFAHWWDYGYYVQTGGQRATLSDGGNANPTINYLTGRYLLTGENDFDALYLLGSRNATNVLVVVDEIGKYSAFSAIGSDADYDRYSWINVFSLNTDQSTQTENLTTFVFTGGSVLDDEISYNDMYFPAYSAGVLGFLVPVHLNENSQIESYEDATAIIVYNGQYYSLPLQCVFIDGQEHIFYEDGEKEGLPGCFQVIPSYSGNEYNPVGAGLYLSHDVWHTWFAHHYLFGQDSEYFTTIYNDENSLPLALYQGRIIGPLKIWEVNYPEELDIPEEFYITELPEGVNDVRNF